MKEQRLLAYHHTQSTAARRDYITLSSRKHGNTGKERLSSQKWFVTQMYPGLFPDKVMGLNNLLKQICSKMTANNIFIET